MITADLKPIVDAILAGYALPIDGEHGVIHWARVLENGLRLAEQTAADVQVVALFAVFHDSRRVNEGTDPGHGQRGAELAREFRGSCFNLSDAAFDLLFEACADHTDKHKHQNTTIQTCWDSDRLDIGRVGMQPSVRYLNTDAAKSKEMIQWADGRAAMHWVPDFVGEIWKIKL